MYFSTDILFVVYFCLSAHAFEALLDRKSSAIRSKERITSSVSPSLLDDAISPTCITTLVPVTSSCHIGVHTLATSAGKNKRAAHVTLEDKAITAGCTTSYSTSTSCHIGVHLQPTFTGSPVTVTETSSVSSDGSMTTITTRVTAQISVSTPDPAATGTGDYTVFLSPKLKSEITELANSYCPASKNKRQLSCQLSQSAQAEFKKDVAKLIVTAMSIAKDPQALAISVTIAGTLTSALLAGAAFKSIYSFPAQSISKAHQSGTTATSTTSTSTVQALTYYPFAPYDNVQGPVSQDVLALTSYLEQYFKSSFAITVTVTSTYTRLPCSHGADPQVHSGTAGYCMCTDGKMYPTSRSTMTTTIDGTTTAYVNDCAYTTIPKTSTSLATKTILPTRTNPQPIIPTSQSCNNGTYFEQENFISQVQNFCLTASNQGWVVMPTGGNAAFKRK